MKPTDKTPPMPGPGNIFDAEDIAERKAFLEFSQDDAARLLQLHDHLEEVGAAFTESFYAHLLSFPPMRRLLPDVQSLEQLRHAQTEYFNGLTAGHYGDGYVDNRKRVGQVHQRIGLEPKWYIGAYRKYLSNLMPLIWEQSGDDPQRFLSTYDSLLKIVMFDMGLALDSYFQADMQALQELKHYSDQVIGTMPNGLMVLDSELRLRTINQAALGMLGLQTVGTLVGSRLDECLPDDELHALARSMLDGREETRRLVLGPLPNRQGSILVLDLSATTIDEAPALIIQLQDETDKMQAAQERERFRTALDVTEDAIFLIDRATLRFVDMNATACASLGYTREELLEMGPHDIKPELSKVDIERRLDTILSTPTRSGRLDARHQRKNGYLFPVEIVLRGFESGGRTLVVAVARDVTSRKRAEASLMLAQRALESSANGIIITDCQQPDNPIVYVNPAFERITGYSEAEILGRNCRFLQGDDRSQPGVAAMRKAIAERKESRQVVRNYRKDGKPFWNELYVAPVLAEDGSVTHFVGVQNDISEQKRAEANLLHMATHDALTGLPNRSLLQDRILQAMGYADRTGRSVAVLFIDIDRFKHINDGLGHAAGDALIGMMAKRLRSAVRMVDTVARIGGDEFVVVLTEVARESDVTLVIPTLFAAIHQPVQVGEHELTVTASIGISTYPRDGRDVASLLKNADTAMYQAKESGRNGFRFYTQEMNANAVDRLRLENDLRNAIKGDELVLHYQPQLDTASGRIVAAEALLRWQHPKLGMVSPADFIPLAEETGLIVPIGEWVLRRVCAQLRNWAEAGLSVIAIAVNLSPRQFHQPNIVGMITNALNDYDVPPHLLELEITESSLMRNPEEAAALLMELSDKGLSLSVDDFGTGYSSLGYLKRFPLDALKIDRSFVTDIENNEDSATIASAVIALAHSLGLKVVAEGVELETQMAYLRNLKCDIAQGYLIGRPMPADDLMAFMGTR